MVKVHVPDINQSFIGYLGYVQDHLGRKLNEKELKECLQMYINSVKVTQALEELK